MALRRLVAGRALDFEQECHLWHHRTYFLAHDIIPGGPHSAFASARLMALRRLVAGRALDFEQELCSICICMGPLLTSYMHMLYAT